MAPHGCTDQTFLRPCSATAGSQSAHPSSPKPQPCTDSWRPWRPQWSISWPERGQWWWTGCTLAGTETDSCSTDVLYSVIPWQEFWLFGFGTLRLQVQWGYVAKRAVINGVLLMAGALRLKSSGLLGSGLLCALLVLKNHIQLQDAVGCQMVHSLTKLTTFN